MAWRGLSFCLFSVPLIAEYHLAECHRLHRLWLRRDGPKADIAAGPGVEEALGIRLLDSIFANDFVELAKRNKLPQFVDGTTKRLDIVLRGRQVRAAPLVY